MERLIVALGDADRARSAAAVLARIGDARAVEALVAQLEDPRRPGHRQAVRELDRIGDARAVPSLTIPILIDDLDGQVPADAQDARERLSGMGSAAVEPLIAALDDAKRATGAADALGRIGDTRAVEPLIAMLKQAMLNDQVDSAWAVEAAAEALGRIGDERAVDSLIATLGLSERYDDARAKAASALGKLGDARAVEGLVAAYKSASSERLTSRALEALGEIRDERAVEALIAAIRSGGVTVPVYARRALGKSMDEAEISRRVLASPPRDGADEGWVPILKRDILQFLDSPRTRERERQDGVWWSHDDLRLVATKNYLGDLPPDALLATADRALQELAQEGRLVGTPSGYRAK